MRLAFVMPSSSGSAVAGVSFFFLARSFSSRKTWRSTCSPSRNSVSPGSMTRTFCSICLHDHADVLVVDLHALQAVDLLHFVEQVLLHRARALDPQNVVRIDRTLGEAVAGAHAVALVHAKVLAGGHFVHLRLARLVERTVGVDRRDVDLALAALDLAEPHDAVDLGNRRRILRTARLEQLGDSRQTARDVARLVRFAADLGDDRARRRCCCPSSHGELRAHRDDEVAHALLLAALLLQ